MISHKKRFVFIHIPKNAGTSIETAVRPFQARVGKHQHETIEEINNYQKEGITYFKFSFVRNPWYRIVSIYEDRKKRKWYPMKGRSFEDWLQYAWDETFPKKPIHVRMVSWSQYQWLFDENDNQLVDYIGKVETINKDWNKISKILNINIKLPYVNRGKVNKQTYKQYYNTKTHDIVKERYKVDIEKFQYTFD